VAAPKVVGAGVRDPRGLGVRLVYGPRTQGGWGLGLCPKPNGLGFGSVSIWTQGGEVLGRT